MRASFSTGRAAPATLASVLATRAALRWTVASAALIAASAHVPLIAPHLVEAPYMGALFIGLTVACLGLVIAVLRWDVTAVYAMAISTCGVAIIGYVATRLFAFPQLAPDVGNWLEPLGVVSVAAEAVVAFAAAAAIRSLRRGAHLPDGHHSRPMPR